MAYDVKLGEMVRNVMLEHRGMSERKMFGGLCFMLNGNMCAGVSGKKLMLRVGAEKSEDLLKKPHVKPMDFTGKPLKGMVYVMPAGLKTRAQVKKWVGEGLAFAKSLPKKTKK